MKSTNTPTVTESVFLAECDERSYTTGEFRRKVFSLSARNGTKCEIKSNRYTVGWLRNAEELELLRDEIILNGFTLSSHKDPKVVNVSFSPDQDILAGFWTLVEIVEAIDGLVKQAVIRRSVRFCEAKFDYDSIFVGASKMIRLFIELGNQGAINRDVLRFDKMDSLITIGYSEAGLANHLAGLPTYREHIVPCDLIITRAVEMIKAGSTDDDVAKMIFENLHIVIITPEEAVMLDYTLGLKTTMPEGWEFGGSTLARLGAANITVVGLDVN